MTNHDAIIVENLLYRSIDLGYDLAQGKFITKIPAKSKVIILDIRLENLNESVRQVLIPKKYVKVTPWIATTRIPSPAHWVESGLESRCLAVAVLTSSIHVHNDYVFSKTITAHAVLTDRIPNAHVITGHITGHVVPSANFILRFQLEKTVTGHAVLSDQMDAHYLFTKTITGNVVVSFTSMAVNTANHATLGLFKLGSATLGTV